MWGNNLAKVGLDVYMIPSSSSSSSRRIYYSFELPKKANCTIHKKEDLYLKIGSSRWTISVPIPTIFLF